MIFTLMALFNWMKTTGLKDCMRRVMVLLLALLALGESTSALADSDGFMRGRVTTGNFGVGGVRVQVRAAGSSPNIGFGWIVDVSTDDAGNWVAPIRRTDDPKRLLFYSIHLVKDGFTFVDPPNVAVAVGDAGNVNGRVASGPVSGRVVYPDGSPVKGVTMTLGAVNLQTAFQVPVDVLPPMTSVPISTVNFPNGSGSFLNGVPSDNFGVLIRGTFGLITFANLPANINFHMGSDDGALMWVDGRLLINGDGLHAYTDYSATTQLSTGNHSLEIRMFEAGGFAGLRASLDYFNFITHIFSDPLQVNATAYFYDLGNQASAVTDANGNFTMPAFLGNDYAHAVTPSKAGFTFAPGSAQVYAGQPGSLVYTVASVAPSISSGFIPSLFEDSAALEVPISVVGVPEPEVTVSSSNSALIPNLSDYLRITGTGSDRRLVVRPLPNANGTTTITVTAVNSIGTSQLIIEMPVEARNDAPVAGAATSLTLVGTGGVEATVGGLNSANPAHTIEAWVKPQQTTGRSWLLVLGTPGVGAHHWLLGKPGKNDEALLQLGIWNGTQIGGIPIRLGEWTHLATTWDPVTKLYTLFVNGQLKQQVTATEGFNFSGFPLLLGRVPSPTPGESNYRGSVDELRIWNRALTGGEIRQNMAQPLTGREDNLMLYWRFDEASGVVAVDSAPNPSTQGGRSDGVITDAGYGPSAAATGNGTLQFNGTNSFVSIPGLTSVLPTDEVTVEFWSKADAQREQPAFGLSPDDLGNRFSAEIPSADNRVYWDFGDIKGKGRLIYTPKDSIVGTWQHWAFVASKADNSMSIYRNGILEATKVGMASYVRKGTPTFEIGRLQSFVFGGQIDEFRIWNVARTGAQIQSDMSGSLVGDEPGLLAYYRFDEGVGTTLTDYALPKQDGILTNGPLWDPPNDAFGTLIMDEDSPSKVFLPAFDVEVYRGEGLARLTYSIVKLPVNGVLRFATNGPNIAVGATWTDTALNPIFYIPTPDYTGPDSFTFKVSDEAGASSTRTISLYVAPLNDPPVIQPVPIPNQIVDEDGISAKIPFLVSDAESPAQQLTVSVSSSESQVVPPRPGVNVLFEGAGTNRTVQIVPAPGEVGTTTLTLTVTDAAGASTSTSFQLRVIPKPAYALVDLGVIPGRQESLAFSVNDQTWVSGAAQSQATDPRGVLYKGLGSPDGFLDLGTFGGPATIAYAVNNSNIVVGFSSRPDGRHEAFRWDSGNLVTLDTANSQQYSEARAINSFGMIVGGVGTTAADKAFRWTGAGFNLLPVPAGTVFSSALGVNDAKTIVGYVTAANGSDLATYWDENNVRSTIAPLVPDLHSRATDLNNANQIVGWSQSAKGVKRAFLFDGSRNANLSLGTLAKANDSAARSINDFGQIVGQSGNGPQSQRAFLYSAGRLIDLNDIVHDHRDLQSRDFEFSKSNWELTDAVSINRDGAIAGVGRLNGNQRAFLAIPGWVIGKQIARPLGAVPRIPEIEIVRGQSGDTPDNSFFWSAKESKLYAIRPVTARLKWFTSTTDTTGSGSNLVVNTDRIIQLGVTVWPKVPTVHVASAPVEVEPQGVDSFSYSFQDIRYTTMQGVSVEPSTKRFNSTRTGYSVLYYLKSDGFPPSPQDNPPYFEVVRTVDWDDARYQLRFNWDVGKVITFEGHTDYFGKNGHVLFEHALYDGGAEDRAYDRFARLGPIIPVNKPTERTASLFDPLAVAWYHTNRIGVAWADTPALYTLDWPASALRIVIASEVGSGPLDPTKYPSKKVYNQPNRALPGYNPNEEHAVIVPSKTGEALYALRNDINATTRQSDAYSLLKFRDPRTLEWRIEVFKVVPEEAPYFFQYTGEAGKEISPPFPLSTFITCAESSGVPGKGPWWEDYNGKIYARAAGVFGQHTNVNIRWSYSLQPGFSYDLNTDGTNDFSVGTCISWLDRRSAGSLLMAPNTDAGVVGTSIEVVYDIRWPDDTPVLQIGESLVGPRRGLPGVFRMADVQMVYDDLNPTDAETLASLARMYDPISARTVNLPAGWVWPTSIKRQNINGKEYFPDLPYSLKQRLVHDPINKSLMFLGILDEQFSVGLNPLLLPNVIAPRERVRILQLAEGNLNWQSLIDALYNLTRNPNQVDLDPKDGRADADLRIGLITEIRDGFKQVFVGDVVPGVSTNYTTNILTVSVSKQTNVVAQKFGDGPKSLTAGLNVVPSAQSRALKALQFDGVGNSVDLGFGVDVGASFTEEAWVFPAANDAAQRGILGSVNAVRAPGIWLLEKTRLVIGFSSATRFVSVATPSVLKASEWNHVAATFDGSDYIVYVNGRSVFSTTNFSGLVPENSKVTSIGRVDSFFPGRLDEVRLWNIARSAGEIRHDMVRRLNGAEDGLVGYWRFDEGSGSTAANAVAKGVNGTVSGASWIDSTAPTGIPPRYMTLAENNNPALPGLPVALHIIQIDDGPYQGDIKVLPGDNIFDERVSMRHSSDFGGAPERLTFEWYYKPDSADFDPTDLPQYNPSTGDISDPRGWLAFPVVGDGVNDITLGEGNASGLLTLGDNWFIARYRGYPINGETNWSEWVGDPAGLGTPRAALVEGWIKRVIRGLNPFDARTRDFHSTEVNTFASMLVQAGTRFEGPIAFNPSGDNINKVGLIEAYTTVLQRGKSLSIEGVPSVDFDPANNALLLVSSRIADLYTLLGNEAFADAEDPTIGFGTKGGDYGTLAPSIFAFQNQLDSLLDEELALLRGRDDRNSGVRAAPVYNRLFWNFTLGDGEVAYQQSYNVRDQNFDGFLDERDARILYPQGHGDAWGHYLTAIKTYYELLRHPKFTWKPRTEPVSVGGTAIEVDFLDERKFARIAAAKAKAGRQIVDLTYRSQYVEDPQGQWQGYKDTDPTRGWGVDDWARRAGQGAFLDWAVANAVLPSQDPNPEHVGIRKIDRTTVSELNDIIGQATQVQIKIDEADAGLNPLGLAKGAVPFDIDPTFLEVGSTAQIGRRAVQGLTQFDQILERAVKALKNAGAVWDDANRATQLLRKNQDSIDEFTKNIRNQEFDFKSRLIEVFGYPYAGDIGAGKTYPSGYDGPDLYHFMYVNRTQITGENSPQATAFTGFFAPTIGWLHTNTIGGDSVVSTNQASTSKDFWLGFAPESLDVTTLPVLYPLSKTDYGFEAPASWGQRRAPGDLQIAISDMVQAQAQLKIALQNYDGIIQDIQAAIDILKAQYDVDEEKLFIRRQNKTDLTSANDSLLAMKRAQLAINRINDTFTETTDNLLDGVPKFTVAGLAFGGDLTAPLRGVLRGAFLFAKLGLSITGDVLEGEQRSVELGKDATSLQTDIDLAVQDERFEVLQRVKELEHQIRNEAAARLAAYNQAEILNQAMAKYHARLAEGERLIEERVRFRKDTAAQVTDQRYQDMTFRIFRNDSLQKYRASFDLAARYVYLAATAYDYEVNFLGTDQRAGRRFLTDIVRQRSLGQLVDGDPAVGTRGLADPLARLSANWEVLKPRFGVVAPQIADTRFSLREEWFRIKGRVAPDLGADNVANTPDEERAQLEADAANAASDASWRNALASARVANLWDVPEFRRYCRPFAPEQAGAQPGIVIRFPTTITFGLNFFGWPLAGGDSAYDPTQFSTKIARAGVWLSGSDGSQISQTPRVYLVPIGMDIQRTPTGDTLATREWRILDQAIPAPFPIGASDLSNPNWIPVLDSLGGSFVDIRRYGSFPARHDSGAYSEQDLTNDTRLIGRSAWNTEWMLIIPGGTLLFDPNQGIEALINTVSDIKLYFQTYSYSGD